jgi:hypothetical protein
VPIPKLSTKLPTGPPGRYDKATDKQGLMFSLFSLLFSESFRVEYNSGLLGMKEFKQLGAAIADAEDASSLLNVPIEIYNRAGELLLAI